MNKLVIVGMSIMLMGTSILIAESDADYRCGQQPYQGYGMPGMMGQGYGMPGMMGQGYGMPGMMGQGYGMPGMMGQGMMGQGYGMQGMMGQGYDKQRDYEPIPEVKAKKMFDQYIKDNLKGFEITKVEKVRVPMGLIYIAIVKDSNGNEFELHLNPWGYIRGPFVR